MADNENTEIKVTFEDFAEVHPLVGLPDGHVDHADEKIVYEFDDDGNFIGWHKETTK